MVKHAISIDERNHHSKRDQKGEDCILDLTNGKKAPNSFQNINCHAMFDVKIEDFRRKACLVPGGHKSQTLGLIIYSSKVTRETTCMM